MKFLENYQEHKHIIKVDKTKEENYMFSRIHKGKNGDLIGYCKFCKKNFDIAEHTNKCTNIPK